jgi:L-rhamnonate dehydratase
MKTSTGDRIVRASAHLLELPVDYPLKDEPVRYRMNLVMVETESGVRGYAVSRYPMPTSIHEFLVRQALPSLIGANVEQSEGIRNALYWEISRTFASGVFILGSSLIDQALWDARGRILERPVWKLLGGASPELDAYITFGTYRYDIDELQTLARRLVGEGHTALKMVLGAADNPRQEIFGAPDMKDLERDMRRVAAVREAIGPDVTLYVDANKNPSLPMARQYERRLREYSPAWFEDPVDAADPLLLRRLRDTSEIPIAAGGSNMPGIRAARDYLLAEAVDILQPNVRDVGGFMVALRIAGMAEAFGVPVAMGGNWPEPNIHLHAAITNPGPIEFHLVGWGAGVQFFDGASSPAGGHVLAPDAPGLGMTPKDGVIDEFAVLSDMVEGAA